MTTTPQDQMPPCPFDETWWRNYPNHFGTAPSRIARDAWEEASRRAAATPALEQAVTMKAAKLIQDAVNDDPRMLDDQVALAGIISRVLAAAQPPAEAQEGHESPEPAKPDASAVDEGAQCPRCPSCVAQGLDIELHVARAIAALIREADPSDEFLYIKAKRLIATALSQSTKASAVGSVDV